MFMNETFIAVSPVTKDLLEIVKKTSLNNSPVMIIGELGTGKKSFGHIIHESCSRKDYPFYYYNCRKNEEIDLLKVCSESGAVFFEDIECLSQEKQKLLLEVIQNKNNAKIIASSKGNPGNLVQDGRFLEELFFRLNVFPVRVPSLKVRKEDVVPLAQHFAQLFSEKFGIDAKNFSESALQALENYSWPGNVLELENVVSRAVLLSHGQLIQAEDLHLSADQVSVADEFISDEDDKTLKTALNTFKRNYVIKILDDCNWNQTKAGKILGIQRTYVSRLMNELHIREKNI